MADPVQQQLNQAANAAGSPNPFAGDTPAQLRALVGGPAGSYSGRTHFLDEDEVTGEPTHTLPSPD